VSGQEASFLAGGKIFIPVARSNNATGTVTITLEEKEFGVGLKFTPVVLDGDMISLKVAPEVSELSRTGSPFVTTGGVTTVLPSFTTRRAQTTVQMRDGQSLAIAGLIKNNVTENISRFPFLGEIPVIGALFRSTEFQTDRSELLFVITPRLVQSLQAPPPLPTDSFKPPSREEMLLKGQLEGSGRRDAPSESAKPPAATDKLQIK
jgi:pilus assembly protein CpaC